MLENEFIRNSSKLLNIYNESFKIKVGDDEDDTK